MMKKAVIALLLTIIVSSRAFACLNGDSKFLKDGTYIFMDRESNVPYGHDFNGAEAFEKGIKQVDSLYKATNNLDYLSDKGLLLILLKQYDQAIKLYLEIEQLQPNRYSTASNIGTAYELSGENEKALQWIKKSVELDPKSHKNSEWIHVNILEAKIKGEAFYTTSFLLHTEFGPGITPDSKLSQEQLQNLSEALYYQLNERISFVAPKEKIVAQLLFDLGNIAFLLSHYTDAVADYEQAKKYGLSGPLIEERIKEADRLSKMPERERQPGSNANSLLTYALWIAGFIFLATLATIIYKRKKKQRL